MDVGGALILAALVLGGVVLVSGGPGRAIVDRAAEADTGTAAIVLAISVGIVAITGSAALVGDADLDLLVINEEQTIPAYFGSALLLVGGALALGIAVARPEGDPSWPWILLGLVLIWLGFDEAAEIHERLESRADLPAPVVLAPVALAGLAAFAGAFRRLQATPAALPLFLAGGAAWALSQALDPIHAVEWKSAIEETLELSGSALFLLALHRVARDLSRR